jgi:hypothetical protein
LLAVVVRGVPAAALSPTPPTPPVRLKPTRRSVTNANSLGREDLSKRWVGRGRGANRLLISVTPPSHVCCSGFASDALPRIDYEPGTTECTAQVRVAEVFGTFADTCHCAERPGVSPLKVWVALAS